jgi:phage terminase large subunit-like protein
VTAPTWTTACPDWEDRIKSGRSLLPCGPLFPDQAALGMAVFRSLPAVGVVHPEGLPQTPTYGEVCGQWHLDLAEALLGAYDRDAGERLIRECFVKVPKKNWKSGFIAGLMAALMVRNWRQSNEAAVIAPTKEAADNVFKPLRDSIKADPQLRELFHIQPIMRTVTHRVTGISCRVYAADTDTVAGKIWAFVIFDELWQLAKRRGAEDMVLEATGGQASRPEGLVISITTESDEEPVGIHKAKEDFARGVRDGKIHAPWFLPLIYEWPADMLKARAFEDPANFHLVNPNWGLSVDPEDFGRKHQEAKEAGAKALALFYAKRLNVPPSLNVGGSWAGAEFWSACAEPGLTLGALLERSEVVTVGIDGGGLDDLLGLTLIGREAGTGRWLWWSRAWAHPVVLERRKDIAAKLRDLERAGDLVIVKAMGDDAEELADIVKRVHDAGLLPEKNGVGADQAGIGAILDAMVAAGVPQSTMVGVQQGWRLTGAVGTAERYLAAGDIVHGDQALMRWVVGNAKTRRSGNAVLVDKQTSGSAKIDPLMAGFNAMHLMSMNPSAMAGSHSQGFVSL